MSLMLEYYIEKYNHGSSDIILISWGGGKPLKRGYRLCLAGKSAKFLLCRGRKQAAGFDNIDRDEPIIEFKTREDEDDGASIAMVPVYSHFQQNG